MASQIQKQQDKAWNSFRAKIRMLRKQQQLLLKDYAIALEKKKLAQIRSRIKDVE